MTSERVDVAQIIDRRLKAHEQKVCEFWAKPEGWPTPPFAHVFLAHAIQAVGKHRYGSAWTGDEPIAWGRNEKTDAPIRFKGVIDVIVTQWEAGEINLKCWPKNGGPARPLPVEWLFSSLGGHKHPLRPATVVAACSIRQPVERTLLPRRQTLGVELFWLGIEHAHFVMLLKALSVQTNPPSPSTAPAIVMSGKINAQTAFKRWFVDQVAASPQQRSKSRGVFKVQAMKMFDGLSGAGFLKVWGEVTRDHPAWSAPGRPKRRSQ